MKLSPSLQFANALGFDRGTVRSYRKRGMPAGNLEAAHAWIKANGIEKRRPRRYPEKVCAACLYRTGLGVKRVARLMPFHSRVISRWMNHAGIIDPESRNQIYKTHRRNGSAKYKGSSSSSEALNRSDCPTVSPVGVLA